MRLLIFLLTLSILFGQPTDLDVKHWRIHLRGVGPIAIGATQRQVEISTGFTLYPSDPKMPNKVCFFMSSQRMPGLSLMFTGRSEQSATLARIYVDSTLFPTLSGVRPGTSLPELNKAYGAKLKAGSNHYTGEPEFVFMPTDKVDASYRIVFETDGKAVRAIGVGKLPEIQWVESCS